MVLSMNINNEADAYDAIEKWRMEPAKAQLRNLQLAIESLELSQMYYEQKGNDHGIERAAKCITVLLKRKKELENLLKGLI